MKASRQETILRIISESDIENQSQLINALKRNGFNSTQATVSRDIRELRLVKELTSSGSYRYTTSPRGEILNYSSRLKAILKESVTSFDFAQNIVVIKTLPGLASAVCSALDGMKISDLVGTLAGDDTAFMVLRDEKSAELFCNDIHAIL